MSDDNSEFTTDSSPGEQPFESTHEHETADLADADREAEVEEWIRFDPFRSEGMRRLTLGTMGTGKTERIARHARHRANDAETAESIDLKGGGEENGG